MTLLPSASAPFGLLEPIHRYIIDTAQPLTAANGSSLNYSTALLAVQALLLQYPNTRLLRAAVGVVCLAVTIQTWTAIRFVEPWFDALNNGLGVGFLHNTFKILVFALIEDPVVVPYEAKGLWRIVAAVDVVFNSRWLGLRKLRYDGLRNEEEVQRERLRMNRPSSFRARVRSIMRHASYAAFYWFIFNTTVETIRALSWDTIGRSDPPPNAYNRFIHHTAFVLLPNSRYAIRAPRWGIDVLIKFATGCAVWISLVAWYHSAAILFVASGLHAANAWDIDTFTKPLASDSLFDFWRRWHQLFTQHFSLISTYILSLFNLPPRHALAVPIIFLLSGSMHALGQLSMEVAPDPLSVASFFWLSGLGVSAELGFRRFTGKRVGGVLGRVWVWGFLYWGCTAVIKAEYQSGLGGSKVCPAFVTDLGRPVVRAFRRYLLDREDGGLGF